MKYALLALALIAPAALADEPTPPPAEPPKAEATAPIPAGAPPKPGEVYMVDPANQFQKLDMTKFYVLAIDWRAFPQFWPDVDVGLRADGVVVWRKKQ